jgi:preprotein translocase subunit SecG
MGQVNVNTPGDGTPSDSGSGAGFIVGIIVAILIIVLLVYFLLLAPKNGGGTTPSTNPGPSAALMTRA